MLTFKLDQNVVNIVAQKLIASNWSFKDAVVFGLKKFFNGIEKQHVTKSTQIWGVKDYLDFVHLY